MRKHSAVRVTGDSIPSVLIGFDVTKLDVLVQDGCHSPVGLRAGRPFLSMMAFKYSNQIWCYAITMKYPTASHPLTSLVFPKQSASTLRGCNLVIHADRALFSPELIEKHFSTAVFAITPQHSMPWCFLEHPLTKLTQALRRAVPHSARWGSAETPKSTKLEDLKQFINDFIGTSNIVSKENPHSVSTFQMPNDQGEQK
ncbi:hypothetical protein LJY18_16925 [Pseudomonas sp. MMS21-TM103]|uniref:hypothetical protein n=1 Tax=Pseudomonas sp. MMS21 TM103 TaxID=2886506 RepID=UPI001EDE592F|nr:hypothetical protein [Pseudomonas sp. MMS21 TM103]MCG4454962.1 hypothetical protein [Pseudomonas sp. MMS21 TM103]